MARIVICDKEWYKDNILIEDEITHDKLITIDYKNNFSYEILNEVSKRKNDEICIIGSNYNEKLYNIDQIIKFTRNNYNAIVIRSENLHSFDFTNLKLKKTIICFPADIFTNNPNFRQFSSVFELQKYFISISINSNKLYLYMLDNKLKFKRVETDEKKRLSNNRKRKKKNEKVDYNKIKKNVKSIDSNPVNQINKGKPKILIVCDVKGWAWWIKSNYIKNYISNYYDIDIISVVNKNRKSVDYKSYDIYYSYSNEIGEKFRLISFFHIFFQVLIFKVQIIKFLNWFGYVSLEETNSFFQSLIILNPLLFLFLIFHIRNVLLLAFTGSLGNFLVQSLF